MATRECQSCNELRTFPASAAARKACKAHSCFRCGAIDNLQRFDGLGAANPRMICNACEFADWKATIRSLAAPQG